MVVRERGAVKNFDWVRMEECKKETHVRFNLSWHLFFFYLNLSWHTTLDIFKIKNKPLATSVFSIKHLTARTILTQG
jgi:hypothetical protein